MEFGPNLMKIEQNVEENQQLEQPSQAEFKIADRFLSFGQWNSKEVLKYFLFIYHHRQKFQTKSLRKSLKVFKQMAKFIKTRNSSQCRTHHQNLMNKLKNIQNALTSFVEENPDFLKKYEKIKQSLQILDDMEFCEDTSTVVRKPKPLKDQQLQSSAGDSKQKSQQDNKNNVLIPQVSHLSKQQIQELRMQKFLQCQMLFGLWISKVAQLSHVF